MKKLLLLLTFVLSVNAAFSQRDNASERKKNREVHTIPIDEKNGFKMVKFGETVDAYRDALTFIGLAADTMFFVKSPELLRIGDIPIQDFTIATKNGIVYAVMLKIKGHAQDIKDVFIEAYGSAYETPNRYMDKFIWRGKKVAMIYDYSSVNNIVDCTFTGLEVLKMVQQEDAIKTKERSEDI